MDLQAILDAGGPWQQARIIGDQLLIQGDCLEVMGALPCVDHTISDPPYEAVMQNKWGVLSSQTPSSHVRHKALGFGAIDEVRDDVAIEICRLTSGWTILFCMAEGVRAWRDCIEATGARYKRAMVWVKPDAMPQFNGQGPSVGHEMLVSAWCGAGKSRWNGGGRPGTFIHNKNTPGGSVHPTQKPMPLIMDLVELFSFPKETVLDPFMGSGTTLVACQRLGRQGIGIELDADYWEISCKRVQEVVNNPPLFKVEAPKPTQDKMDL